MNERSKLIDGRLALRIRTWVVVAKGVADEAIIGPDGSALVEQRPIGKDDKKLSVFQILA